MFKKSQFYNILMLSVIVLSSCKMTRFVVYNFVDINDHKKFPSRNIESSSSPFLFSYSSHPVVIDSLEYNGRRVQFEDFLKDNNTVAFLVIKNDSIHYERYFGHHDSASVVPSFSMAKAITSILVGCAIDDGIIQSVHDPITDYVPELSNNGFDKVTIEHLLQMTSGLKFNESSSNPFGDVATYYYGTNIRKQLKKVGLKAQPGTQFEYLSGGTQILGWVLERALNGQSISEYAQKRLWQPLGMEFDASWSLDRKKNGMEKTFCCFNARARDYAKIGRLYLQKGQWAGQQIISTSWVEKSTMVDTANGAAWDYQYQWWLPSKNGDFMAEGLLGQYIYVHPENNVIIVRLGKNKGKTDWPAFLAHLGSEVYGVI